MGITVLKGETFRDCYSLQEITVLGDITELGDREFFNDPLLKKFTVSPDLSEIGEDVFKVDFTEEPYDVYKNYETAYNNGNHQTLTIYYYEDTIPMQTYVAENTQNKRVYTPIRILNIAPEEPYKTEYQEGETLETENLILTVNYEDVINQETVGKSREILGDLRSIEYTKTELNECGDNEINVTYFDKLTTLNIHVSHDWDPEAETCTICGEECTDQPQFVETVPPTCEEDGYDVFECNTCGHIEITNYVQALQHEYDEGTITKEATCEEEGIKTYTCELCGEVRQEAIPAKGHTEVVDQRREPTCTTKGLTEGKHCSVCNKVLVAQEEIPALGHEWNEGTVTIEPTCETKGVKTYTCEHDSTHTKTEEIAALGHNYVDTVVAPTCKQRGYTTHTCTRCGDSFKDTYVATIPHNYQDGKCTMCGEKEPKIEVTSEKYSVESNISNILPNTSIENFIDKIETNATEIKVYDKNKKEITDNKIKAATGMTVEFTLGEEKATYTIVVTGDLTGNGKMEDADLLKLARYRAGLDKTLSGAYLEAADVYKDSKLADDRDLLKMVRVIVGLDSL